MTNALPTANTAASTAPTTAIVPATRPVNPRLIRLPDTEPPERVGALAGEYIGLSLAGGLALGLVIGALVPRAPARKLSRRASALAAIAAEAALVLAKQALDHAGDAKPASVITLAKMAIDRLTNTRS